MPSTSRPEARELQLLTRIRTQHHLALVETGVARRIIDADIPINYMANKDEITEGTLFFPRRSPLSKTSIGVTWGGSASLSGSCSLLPQDLGGWMDLINEFPDADVLMLGRLDAHPRGWGVATVFTGIQLTRNAEVGIIPLDGVSIEDQLVITGMMREVQGLIDEGQLTCIDDDSLINDSMERHGPTPMP